MELEAGELGGLTCEDLERALGFEEFEDEEVLALALFGDLVDLVDTPRPAPSSGGERLEVTQVGPGRREKD
ncbi:hypothetical protein G6O69_05325 [Pseudenhygromyxa sp. WMMC2535]|uniref:hypothetical protein n=1 Tax=Pseudenhygromyxa sp. WMMC2535 TaxID=2712867 RepID=UPI001552D72C|nr:hypothetical protein [Pseudenhygromyxa sp. WMMC2535]NVB37241.1 hypothetical protein [Pseudenhygromyxa sp. WMMC2535]